MDLNFHYYVTYAAACQSGFPSGSALLIARAAQYVDNCEGVTVNSTWSLFWKNAADALRWDNKKVAELANIWPVFHFLPGDYSVISHDMVQTLAYPKDSLICGTESTLTEAIVNGARDSFLNVLNDQDLKKALLRIGITMHVLADTFAHQGFAGIPAPEINEVEDVMHIAGATSRTPEEILTEVRYAPLDRSRAPTSKSFGYLGHGRIGVCLDLPCETLHYKAAWHDPRIDAYITRYNPLEFCCAYLQMMDAMRYIQGTASSFQNKLDRAAMIDRQGQQWNSTREILQVFLQADSDEALQAVWRGYVHRRMGAGSWPEACRSLSRDRDLEELFQEAAMDHHDLVMRECPPLREYIDNLL